MAWSKPTPRALLLAPIAALMLMLAGCSAASREASFLKRGKLQLEKKDYPRAVLEFRNAERVMPQDAEPYYQEGLAYLAWGNPGNAYWALTRATQLDPKNLAAQIKLTELLSASRQDLPIAEEHGKAAVMLAPDDPDALSALALTELNLGKSTDAARYLEQSLEKFPRHLKSSLVMAVLKLSQKDMTGAEEILKKAVSQAPKAPEPLIALGDLYLMTGKTGEAESVYRRALDLDPRNSHALLYLARIEVAAGRKDEAEDALRKLAALPDKQYKPLHALYLLQTGQAVAGLAELEKVYRQDPEDRNLRTRLISIYVQNNRAADALKLLATALKKNDQDTEALLERAEIELKQGKLAEAQADVNLVLYYKADSAEAHYVLSRLHHARGNALNRRQELIKALRLNPNLLPARLELAHIYTLANSTGAAINLLDQAPAPQKSSVVVIAERNWALLAARKFTELRSGVARGLAVGTFRDLLVQDATLKMLDKDFAGARKTLEEVLGKRPEDVKALELLVQTYVSQNEPKVALERLQSYAARQPRSAPVQYLLGQHLLENGKTVEARVAFLSAKAADPHFIMADLVLAQMDRDAGNIDAARETLSKVLAAKDPATELPAQMLMGDIESSAGNHGEAIKHWRKVVEENPNYTAALNNLAYNLLEYANQPDEALQYAEKAHELAPDNPDIEDTVGWALYRKGIFGTALGHIEHAVSEDGKRQSRETAVRKYHLAMVCIKNGQRERGLQVMQVAMRLDPNLPEARMAQSLLAGGR